MTVTPTALRYFTDATFKQWLDDDTIDDIELAKAAVNAAEEFLDSRAARRLVIVDAGSVAVERSFAPNPRSSVLHIRDCAEISSVVENGVTLVDGVGYQAEPFDNEHPSTGAYRPFDTLRRLDTTWYTNGPRPTVTVTGKWGWAQIPLIVVEACKILAADFYANRRVRHGHAATSEAGFSAAARQNLVVREAIGLIRGPRSFGFA